MLGLYDLENGGVCVMLFGSDVEVAAPKDRFGLGVLQIT